MIESLRFEGFAGIFYYFILASVAFVIRMLIFLKFFCFPVMEFWKREEKCHGKYGRSNEKENIFLVVFFAPVLEELFFRGPILLLMKWPLVAIGSAFVSALIFGLLHLTNEVKYADGFIRNRSWLEIKNVIVGGLFYGFMAVTTGSLWPAIFCHSLWNLTFTLIKEEQLLKGAVALRRWFMFSN